MSNNISSSLNRIVVQVEGGTMKAVYSERNLPIQIAVLDLDTEFGEGVCLRTRFKSLQINWTLDKISLFSISYG